MVGVAGTQLCQHRALQYEAISSSLNSFFCMVMSKQRSGTSSNMLGFRAIKKLKDAKFQLSLMISDLMNSFLFSFFSTAP